MGYNTAVDLSTEWDTEFDLEMAISIHLQSNHYPPVPLSMVQPCIDAIDAAWNQDYNLMIELPPGVTYRGGATSAPAYAIIENHHLDAWVQDVD